MTYDEPIPVPVKVCYLWFGGATGFLLCYCDPTCWSAFWLGGMSAAMAELTLLARRKYVAAADRLTP